VVRQVAEGRADTEALARNHNLAFIPSLTNFVAIDLASAENSVRMVELLEERGVFVRRPGVPPLDRFVRVSVGTPEERATFAEVFAEALSALRAES
jgi:histidinol-phosphate aminotransferase